jgi:hypothetical protein
MTRTCQKKSALVWHLLNVEESAREYAPSFQIPKEEP